MKTIQEAIRLVVAERKAQDKKWGREFHGRPDERWLAILAEEFGELAQAFLQEKPNKDIEEELVQVAAVAVSWLEFRTPRSGQIANDVGYGQAIMNREAAGIEAPPPVRRPIYD